MVNPVSTRTEFAGVETRLGEVDLSRAIAYITYVSKYIIYRTTTKTTYNTVTYEIVSRVITAISRVYNLEHGNIKTQISTVIPTYIVAEVRTETKQGAKTETGGNIPRTRPPQAIPI